MFAFSEGISAELIGSSLARMLAASFGLDAHTENGADLMSEFFCADATFTDECLSVQPQNCTHDPCRGGGQNSYQELLARLGPAM